MLVCCCELLELRSAYTKIILHVYRNRHMDFVSSICVLFEHDNDERTSGCCCSLVTPLHRSLIVETIQRKIVGVRTNRTRWGKQ